MNPPATRILFIQHELYTWQRARMWGYTWHLGLEEGLRANHIEFTTLLTPWFPYAREICAGKTFDQVWINDITHAFEPGACGGYQLGLPELEWIADLAPVRLGFLMESLEYTQEELAGNAALGYARLILETTGKYLTHLMTPDEKDVPVIRDLHNKPVSLCICPVPDRFVTRDISVPPQQKPVFRGTPYGERARWLSIPEVHRLVNQEPSSDNQSELPRLFDQLQNLAKKTVSSASFDPGLYDQYLQALRRIRGEAFALYLHSLLEGSAVLNFPSFGKIYTGRIFEGMAAGRAVITVQLEDRPLLQSLFQDGSEILLYPKDDPLRLVTQIKRVLRDPELGRQVAMKARDKLLQHHTTEHRVAQILDWVATGQDPDYISTPAVKDQSGLLNQSVPKALSPAVSSGLRSGKRRILLISPPYARLLGVGNGRFPLSFGSMGTILSMNGHAVAIYDADFDPDLLGHSETYEQSFMSQNKISEALNGGGHYVWKEIERKIREFQPEVIGITTMTNKFPMAVRVAEIAKSLDQGLQVVIGGHHSSIFGQKLVQDRNIDFAVIGEGEMTFLELINRLGDRNPDYSGVNGLVYKAGKQVIVNEPRALLENLDVLPIADRDLMLNEGYISENNIMTSRGCPFNCSYCGAQVIWKRKVRRRSVGDVTREIDYLLKRGSSRMVNFWDDSFTCDRKYTKELTEALKKFDGLRFSCITRLDLIERETLVQLKEAGCSLILFGIESGNDDILKRIDKKMTRELIRRKTGLVEAVGIPWLGFFIMGYPGETRENILETLSFMKELNPSYAEINIFNPLPGTRIWNVLEQQGRVSSDMDFSRFSQASTENFFTNGSLSREEFRELALFVAREFDQHNRSRNGNR